MGNDPHFREGSAGTETAFWYHGAGVGCQRSEATLRYKRRKDDGRSVEAVLER
jgi:hypothetical protein